MEYDIEIFQDYLYYFNVFFKITTIIQKQTKRNDMSSMMLKIAKKFR